MTTVWFERARRFSSKCPDVVLFVFLAGVGLSGHLVLFLPITVVAVVFAQSKYRIALATVACGVFFQLPWMLVVSVSAVAWTLQSRTSKMSRSGRLSSPIRFLLLIGPYLLLGGILGLIAAAFALPEIRGAPLLLHFEPPGVLVVVAIVIAFAVLNSFGEEILWRQMLYGAAEDRTWPIQFSMQIASFGLAHFSGIPGGFMGCLLAGFFAAVAVIVRRRVGLVAAVMMHLTADFVIFFAVYMNADFEYVTISAGG